MPLDKARLPLTRPRSTYPPAATILAFSPSLVGLWSKDSGLHWPLTLMTVLESPALPQYILSLEIITDVAAHPDGSLDSSSSSKIATSHAKNPSFRLCGSPVMRSRTGFGAGPSPRTVADPASICVRPASCTMYALTFRLSALANSVSISSMPEHLSVILACPRFFHRCNSGRFWASVPGSDISRSVRTTRAIRHSPGISFNELESMAISSSSSSSSLKYPSEDGVCDLLAVVSSDWNGDVTGEGPTTGTSSAPMQHPATSETVAIVRYGIS